MYLRKFRRLFPNRSAKSWWCLTLCKTTRGLPCGRGGAPKEPGGRLKQCKKGGERVRFQHGGQLLVSSIKNWGSVLNV